MMGSINRKSVVGMGFAALAAGVTLSYSAYRYGMFFDTGFYRLEWLIIVAALMLMAIRVVYSRLQRGTVRFSIVERSGQQDRYILYFSSPLIGLIMIAFLFLLSLMHEPASVQGTIEQAIRWSTYAAYMWLIVVVFGSEIGRSWLSAALQGAGAFVIWGALAGWMGWISFPAIVMTTADIRLSAVGARLSGFVQYPNFLGAVMSAYLVWFWLLLVRERSKAEFWFVAVQIVPALMVLLLTESRGAWLAGALSWIMGLLLISRNERQRWLLYSSWTLVTAGAAYRFVVHIDGHSGESLINEAKSGLILNALSLLLVIAASLAGFAFIRRWMLREEGGKRRFAYLAWSSWAAAVIFTFLMLSAVVQCRLSGQFQTAAARKLFYSDAFLLIKNAPLFGQGGDTWRMLFTQTQTQPYAGTEVHSGYLDVMLDLGIIGLIILIFALLVMLYRVWLHDRAGMLPIVVLLTHASIDFDMSFGYYWLLLLSWGVLYSGMEAAQVGIVKARLPKQSRRQRSSIIQAAAVLLAALLLTASAIYSWRFDRSVQYREAASASSGTTREAALRAALGANPYWSRIRIELAKLAPPQERAALLAAGLRYEPQSVPLLWALGSNEAELGHAAQAAAYMRAALHFDRFNRDNQSDAVVTMTRLARQLRAAKQESSARLAAEQAVQFYLAYAAQTRPFKVNGRKFYTTKAAKEAEDESRMILKELDSRSHYLFSPGHLE